MLQEISHRQEDVPEENAWFFLYPTVPSDCLRQTRRIIIHLLNVLPHQLPQPLKLQLREKGRGKRRERERESERARERVLTNMN